MAELPLHSCTGNRVKGLNEELDEYKRTATPSEFNPRAAPPSSTTAADHIPWPPLNNIASPFSAEPLPDSALHAAPKWWVSPSHVCSPTAVFGAPARQLPNHTIDAVDYSRLSLHHGGPAVVKDSRHYAAELSRNNPYLDAALRSPSASWRQMQQQQVNAATPDEYWSCDGSFPSRNAAYPHSARPLGFDQEVFHPVFADHPAYHVLQPARASYNVQQLAAANRPFCSSYANMMSGDGGIKVGDNQYGWGTTDQARSAAKSQSMRALYEENAALRRALLSMRRGSLFPLQGEQIVLSEQDRCIASDVAEGRALSMRERGRWAMQAAGELVGGDGSGSMWAGTPGQKWAAEQPPYGMLAAAATHRRHHAHHHNHGWDEFAADPRLFYGSGSFGGGPEESMVGNRDVYPAHWADMQRECPTGDAVEAGNGEGTSLKQLLVESERAGMNGNKWRRQGKKKAPRDCEAAAVKQDAEEGGQCPMCGGKLKNVEVLGGKKAGLPLRLCPACHPRAAASMPHSTTMKSPPLTAQARHHVATAIFMACRPNTTNPHVQDPKYATTKKVKPKSRLVDLCRHIVGLAAKPSPTA